MTDIMLSIIPVLANSGQNTRLKIVVIWIIEFVKFTVPLFCDDIFDYKKSDFLKIFKKFNKTDFVLKNNSQIRMRDLFDYFKIQAIKYYWNVIKKLIRSIFLLSGI